MMTGSAVDEVLGDAGEASKASEAHSDCIPIQHLQEAVEGVAAEHGFISPSYTVQLGSRMGDNFCSLLYRVEVRDQHRSLALMVKSTVQNSAVRDAIKLPRMFANEAAFYNKILPAYAEALRERGLLQGDRYPHAPRCFLASVGDSSDESARDLLVLQDMRPDGYSMLDRKKGVDAPHCALVLRALADLHASSMAMEHQQQERFRHLRNSIAEIFHNDDPTKKMDTERVTKITVEMIERRFPEGTVHHKKAKEFCSNIHEELTEALKPVEGEGNVICHGDCWTNNILFKYSELGTPERVCLLDYQIARYASPVLDLVYFLFTCTDRALRAEHWDALLQGYHSRLQARLRALGVSDPDALLSWERLQSHLRQRARFAMFMGVVTIPLFTASHEDAPDVSARFEEGGTIEEAFVVQSSDTTLRDSRMSDLLEDMVEMGYL